MGKRGAMKKLGPIAAGAGFVATRNIWRRTHEEDLRGRVAVVTGGSRGLGFLVARELGRAGCKVAICARDEAELEHAAGELSTEGIDLVTMACDVARQDEVDRFVAAIRERFGPVDLLVNNAGIIQVGPVESMTIADFEFAMGVMFWGVLYPTFAVLPEMRARRRGAIVNVTSIGGLVSVPHVLPYNAAKFAAVGFSEGLRAEVAKDGITVTTVAPGLLRTGSYLNALFKGQQRAEYTLFAPLSSLPLVSMDAERAARQIVQAVRRGDAERTLSVPATVLARIHGAAPGATANLFGAINRVLPRADGAGDGATPGMVIDAQIDSRLFDRLTALGRTSARRFHQYPGPEVDQPAG